MNLLCFIFLNFYFCFCFFIFILMVSWEQRRRFKLQNLSIKFETKIRVKKRRARRFSSRILINAFYAFRAFLLLLWKIWMLYSHEDIDQISRHYGRSLTYAGRTLYFYFFRGLNIRSTSEYYLIVNPTNFEIDSYLERLFRLWVFKK